MLRFFCNTNCIITYSDLASFYRAESESSDEEPVPFYGSAFCPSENEEMCVEKDSITEFYVLVEYASKKPKGTVLAK